MSLPQLKNCAQSARREVRINSGSPIDGLF
jgi:hypothetical protein